MTEARTSAREEEVSVFVKGDRHDAVGEVECFLDAVAVVDVNVDVENTRMMPATTSLHVLVMERFHVYLLE